MNTEEKIEVTKAIVRELITYDPISGKAFWNKRDVKWFDGKAHGGSIAEAARWNTYHAGKEICSKTSEGYIRTPLLSGYYLLHRLIWLYMTGEWPNKIDHINGIRDDNRWENLRNVTVQENCRNQRRRANNTSGCTGVYKHKQTGHFIVMINTPEKRRVSLGAFSAFEEAVSVRKAAEIEYGYSERHDQVVCERPT